MAETTGHRWQNIKAIFRLGAGTKGQSCDGTFTLGNLPNYLSDGTLTDSGVPASGLSGGTGALFSEAPIGTLDGTNTTFNLSATPLLDTGGKPMLWLFRNGIEQQYGRWYTLSGNTITFVVAPLSIEYLFARYQR